MREPGKFYCGDLVRIDGTGDTWEVEETVFENSYYHPTEVVLTRVVHASRSRVQTACMSVTPDRLTLVCKWGERSLAYVEPEEYERWGSK